VQALRGDRGPRGERRGADSSARDRRPAPNDAARDSVRTQMRAIRDRTNQRIESVLTADQRTAYRELRQSMENDRRERGDSTRRRPRGDHSRVGGA
jgi:hypothetical protein